MNRAAIVALALCGLTSLAIWASVPALGPLRGLSLLDYLPRYFAAFALYLGAILIIFRALCPRNLVSWTSPLIFLFALLFRLPLLSSSPSLSDDVYRYIWDGRVQNAGLNPFAHRVDSPALDPLDTPNRALVNNPQMASPYLPVAQIMFAVVYRLAPESTLAFQIAAMLFDLLTGLLLMLALKGLNQPPEWALLYLWNPLVVVEFAHGAHVDALMNMLIMAGLWTNSVSRIPYRVSPFTSPILMGLATLVKPIPALVVVALAPQWGWRRLAVYGGTVLAGLAFYSGAGWGLVGPIEAGTGLFGAIRIFLAWWRFNGGFYHWLEVLITGYQTEGAVPVGTPGIETAKATSAMMLLMVLAIVFWRARRKPSPALWLIPVAAYLLLTPTVHPWYVAPLVALLPLCIAGPVGSWPYLSPWLYFSASVALSYLTYLDSLNLRETDFVRQWEYFPLYALLLLSVFWPKRAIEKT